MTKNSIIVLFFLLVLMVVGMFLFTYLYKLNEPGASANTQAVSTSTTASLYNVTRIEGKHFFDEGVHTIVGELALPTPCDLLTTDAVVAESFPEQVSFNFTVINTTEDCDQRVTSQRFKIEARASKGAQLNAKFMGQAVELNLIEASAEETPDSFEIFEKG
jgi:hypothetical protein